MPQTVLLTGITGFIAKRIARDLLAKGHTVVGSLRDASRADEVRAAVGDSPNLRFVEVDLSTDTGWSAAMAGIDTLMHTASPFPMSNPKDPQDVIRPAVDGTLRALKAAQQAGITRVVLTSSTVAITHNDFAPGHACGPDDWSDPNHKTASPYVQSKTLAEKAAWDFAAQHPGLHLTTIHPSLVLGTPLDQHYGTSLRIIERIMAAKDPMQPDLSFGVVDVADVAALHITAMERPETTGQRIIACDSVWRMPRIAALLAEEFPERKIKTRIAPRLMLRGLALFDPAIKGILPQIGKPMSIDTSATTDGLGHTFAPGRDAILASARAIAATHP